MTDNTPHPEPMSRESVLAVLDDEMSSYEHFPMLKALEQKWRERREYVDRVIACSPLADNESGIPQMCDLLRELRDRDDELATILSQIEAAPSPPEPIVTGTDLASGHDTTAVSGPCEHCGKRTTFYLQDDSPPDSSQGIKSSYSNNSNNSVDSSQGEPFAWARTYMGELSGPAYKTKADAEKDVARLNERYPEYERERSIIPLYTTPPPSSPQVAVADGWVKENGFLVTALNDIAHTTSLEFAKSAAQNALTVLAAQDAAAEPVKRKNVDFRELRGILKSDEPVVKESLTTVDIEPQARHWQQAVREILDMDGPEELGRLIEQRARSLAQAEQAAKGDK